MRGGNDGILLMVYFVSSYRLRESSFTIFNSRFFPRYFLPEMAAISFLICISFLGPEPLSHRLSIFALLPMLLPLMLMYYFALLMSQFSTSSQCDPQNVLIVIQHCN